MRLVKCARLGAELLVVLAASLLGLGGCGHARIADFVPAPDRGVAFGVISVSFNDKLVTEGSVLRFSNGESMAVGRDGLIAIHTRGAPVKLESVELPNGNTYEVHNMRLKAGPKGARVYFGNIAILIKAVRAGNAGLIEDLGWQLENRSAEAVKVWASQFRRDRGRFFAAMAEKTAPDYVQGRAIAGEHQEVVPGF